MQGKICLVTGATAGTGYEIAHTLARQGATVLVVGRSPERCALVVEDIREETGNDDVHVLPADFRTPAQIYDLVAQVTTQHQQLDVLVHAARKVYPTRQEINGGVEMTLALNYLANFTLTHNLLKLLQAAPTARIVNVVSGQPMPVVLDDLDARADYDGERVYARTQGAVLLYTRELARRLARTRVTVNAQDALGGADVVASPVVGQVSGKFFRDVTTAQDIDDPQDTARDLWQRSETLASALRKRELKL